MPFAEAAHGVGRGTDADRGLRVSATFPQIYLFGLEMENMRWPLIIAGIVLDLLGIIWILQGLNVLLGSPMSGDPVWFVAGLVVSAIGVLLIVFGSRRTREPSA